MREFKIQIRVVTITFDDSNCKILATPGPVSPHLSLSCFASLTVGCHRDPQFTYSCIHIYHFQQVFDDLKSWRSLVIVFIEKLFIFYISLYKLNVDVSFAIFSFIMFAVTVNFLFSSDTFYYHVFLRPSLIYVILFVSFIRTTKNKYFNN